MNLTLTLNDDQAADIEDWLKGYFDGTSDIFNYDISGTWLYDCLKEGKRYLACNEVEVENEDDHATAISAFGQKAELPKHYYSIDRELGLKVVTCGIFHHGWAFVDGSCDANDLDAIIQTVLLGEVVYG